MWLLLRSRPLRQHPSAQGPGRRVSLPPCSSCPEWVFASHLQKGKLRLEWAQVPSSQVRRQGSWMSPSPMAPRAASASEVGLAGVASGRSLTRWPACLCPTALLAMSVPTELLPHGAVGLH